MRRARVLLAVAAAALCSAGGAGAGAAPARLEVTALDFHLVLSRLTVKSGPIAIELVNFGQDLHDLRLQAVARGSRPLGLAVVRPGGRAELDTSLPPGRYRLWCSLGDHRQRGMRAVLTVARAR